MFAAGTVRRFAQDLPCCRRLALAASVPDQTPSTDFPAVKVLLTPFREASAGEVRRVLPGRGRDAAESCTTAECHS